MSKPYDEAKYRVLSGVEGPLDLENLDTKELEILASEIRDYILEVCDERGGHLAASLGVVELTIALHRVFKADCDRIIWDVGHQSYPHKIICGRKREFCELRTRFGIGGFPRREESPYDAVNSGHASSSISYAAGMALARDLDGDDYDVVAVIGDGSLTGGLAYEALNHAGQLEADMLVVLNDNDMSISKSVGAVAGYLSGLRLAPTYGKAKDAVKRIVDSVPEIGVKIDSSIHAVKERFKDLIIPPVIFERLGWKYIGPVDGHNIQKVEHYLELAKRATGPILLHVITVKGRGFVPAEKEPHFYHGVNKGFTNGYADFDTAESPTYTETFGNTVCELASKNPDILAVTAAMEIGTGLEEFAKLYPERFFDVGIAESHAVTLAAGMALAGKRPFVAMYSTFLQRSYDQILEDVCLHNLPVVFAIDRAGIVGEDGATHHGVFDMAYLKSIPNLALFAPADQKELRDMLYYASKTESPLAIRYPRGSGRIREIDFSCHDEFDMKWKVLKKGDCGTAVLAVGKMVGNCALAADILESEGIRITLVNCRIIKPIDSETLMGAAAESSLLVTVEDGVVRGGFGETVAAIIGSTENGPDVSLIGIPDSFVEHGGTDVLLDEIGLSPQKIADYIRKEILTRMNTREDGCVLNHPEYEGMNL